MKRFVILLMVLLFITSLMPVHAYAFEDQIQLSQIYSTGSGETTQIILYDDGSSLKIITSSIDNSRGTKTGTRVFIKNDSDGSVDWKATLTATFTYNGTTASCTSASCAVTIYDSDWYVVSNSTSHSGNTATTQLTMGYKLLGITIFTRSYTITLSCDANGNLS